MTYVTRFLIAFALLISSAHAASITTLQGKTIDGVVILTGAGVTIAPHDGEPVRIEPGNILYAKFGPAIHPLARGIMLISGETIAIEAAVRLDDAGVHIVRPGGVQAVIPLERVARLLFRPISASFATRIPVGQSGVLLDSGDFFQGEIRDVDAGHVKVESVLFGVRSFDRGSQILAVNYRDIAPPAARWTVRQINGSVLVTDRLCSTDGAITFADAELGAMKIRLEDLSEVQAGGPLLASLAERKPDQSDKGAIVSDATIPGVPMALVGCPVKHGLGQRPGSTASWNINGGYQCFIAHVGVPDSLLPVTKVRFIVLADGKEVFRSTALSSIDDAQAVAVNLTDVKILTLHIDVDPQTPAAAALWADPVCVNR